MAGTNVSLLLALTGFGSLDVNRAADWLDDAQVDYDKFAECIHTFCKETGAIFPDLDIPALALDCIAQHASADELNDYLHFNYLCSSFDISEDDAGRILSGVDENKRNAAWHFLWEFISAIEPDNELDDDAVPVETTHGDLF